MPMEKRVRKFASLETADRADEECYREMNGSEKLEILLELIMPRDNGKEIAGVC